MFPKLSPALEEFTPAPGELAADFVRIQSSVGHSFIHGCRFSCAAWRSNTLLGRLAMVVKQILPVLRVK